MTFAPGKDVPDKIRQLTGGRGADLVIECAGSEATLAQAIDIARPGGRLLLFAIYTMSEARLPFYQLYYKELQLINARAANPGDFTTCIGLVERGRVDLDSMISHVLPLPELAQAISMLGERDDRRMKVVLDHS